MSKAIKYKKQENGYQTKVNDVNQLRNEHNNLVKSISELELKKQCIEDRIRELSINEEVIPEYVYNFQEQQQTNEMEFNDYSYYIPPPKNDPPKARELFEYFGLKQDIKDDFNDLENTTTLQKLADCFGLKCNNQNKLKQQLKILYQYLKEQEYPQQWNTFYTNDLFHKLKL